MGHFDLLIGFIQRKGKLCHTLGIRDNLLTGPPCGEAPTFPQRLETGVTVFMMTIF